MRMASRYEVLSRVSTYNVAKAQTMSICAAYQSVSLPSLSYSLGVRGVVGSDVAMLTA